MIFTSSHLQQVRQLCEHIGGLSESYAALSRLSDTQLAQLSVLYVALQEGLRCYPELSQEIQRLFSGRADEPFGAIYAELVRRINKTTEQASSHPALVHALYQQAIRAPKASYGATGEDDWVYDTVFNAIERQKSSKSHQHSYALFDLLIDSFYIYGAFDPEEQETLDSILTKWNAELEADRWATLPIDDVAQRLRLLTAYYDLFHTDLTHPAPQSVQLLDTFSDPIYKEGDADTLIAYREALRHVYCYHTVRTPYFGQLEQAAKTLPESFSSGILQELLSIDRQERELADLH